MESSMQSSQLITIEHETIIEMCWKVNEAKHITSSRIIHPSMF